MSYVQPNSHIPFILRPAAETVKEAVWSLNATGGGIETYPLCGYLLHSLFLKLTGGQEQKLKCICWEIACRDYDYRYKRFGHERYGECSNYTDKKTVYTDLLEQIRKYDKGFVVNDALKDAIISEWRTTTEKLFDGSLMAVCFKKNYEAYKAIVAGVNRKWIMNDKQLFMKKDNLSAPELVATCGMGLQELFEYVYNERNRCAHNTRSYQHNLPSLKAMMADDYKLQNYFLFMSIILLLDTIYVKLFGIYLEKLR